MRIPKSYKRSGEFWLPDAPDHKVPGTISVEDGGRITLEIFRPFLSPEPLSFSADPIDIIHGNVDIDGMVTLTENTYLRRSIIAADIAKSTLHASCLFANVWLTKIDNAEFRSCRFTLDGILQWDRKNWPELKNTESCTTLEINNQKIKQFMVDDNVDLTVLSHCAAITDASSEKINIVPTTTLILDSKVIVAFDQWVSIVHKMANFFSFVFDQPVSIKNLQFKFESSSDSNNHIINNSSTINVVYESLPFSAKIPNPSRMIPLINFDEICERYTDIFSKWFAIYDSSGDSLNLYMSVINDNYELIDARFLAFVRALEVAHRHEFNVTQMNPQDFEKVVLQLIKACPPEKEKWLKEKMRYANEISLSKRLKALCAKHGFAGIPRKTSKNIIQKIVSTRNYYTHFNKDMENEILEGREFHYSCLLLKFIYESKILSDIGFNSERIQERLERRARFHLMIKHFSKS